MLSRLNERRNVQFRREEVNPIDISVNLLRHDSLLNSILPRYGRTWLGDLANARDCGKTWFSICDRLAVIFMSLKQTLPTFFASLKPLKRGVMMISVTCISSCGALNSPSRLRDVYRAVYRQLLGSATDLVQLFVKCKAFSRYQGLYQGQVSVQKNS
jgi:hypothetical protein